MFKFNLFMANIRKGGWVKNTLRSSFTYGRKLSEKITTFTKSQVLERLNPISIFQFTFLELRSMSCFQSGGSCGVFV